MEKSLIKIFPVAFALTLSLLISACTSPQSGDDQSERTKYAALTDKEQLYLRAMERWNALIADDMHTVYELASPTYRSTYDFRHFVNQYGGQVKRQRAEIRSIDIGPEQDTAEVKVEVFALSAPMPGTGPIEVSTISTGTWVKRDGVWWHVEPR